MPEPERRLLTPAELPALKIGFTNAHRLMLEKRGRFPKRIRLGHRTVAYYEDEILDWIETQANGRPQQNHVPVTSTLDSESLAAIAEMRRRQSIRCP